MNLILEKTTHPPYFTNMRWTLHAMNLRAAAFDWYVREIEANCGESVFSAADRWVDGDELQRVLETHEIQFIWGVFSAFPKGQRLDLQDLKGAPSDGRPWTRDPLTDPLPGALFEIECFDGGATLLIGVPDEAGRCFCKAFPDARPLSSSDWQQGSQQDADWDDLVTARAERIEQGGPTLSLDGVESLGH
ncbi:MAG: hypothetical protein U1E77_12635 [Inhella sp.]